jgi:sortase A
MTDANVVALRARPEAEAASSPSADGGSPHGEPVAAPKPRAATGATSVLMSGVRLIAALVAVYGLFLFVLSGFTAARAQAGLERRFEAQAANAQLAIGGVIPSGAPVARLTIPHLAVHDIVVEGSTSDDTTAGPGHVPATPLPGQRGNSVIVGRRSTYGAPFRHLGRLRPGDRIDLLTGQGLASYRVARVATVPAGSRLAFGSRGGRDTLTLVTSDPPVLASRWLLVVATLRSHPRPTPPHATVLSRAEIGVNGVNSTVPLLLWSEVLLGVAVGFVWLRMRWRTWGAYVIGVPVLLAVAWIVFEQVTRLLPATI